MYMIANTATAIVEPWELFIAENSSWPTGAAIEQLIGTIGLILLAIAMLCGIVSGLNAFYLAGSRLLYSMAIAEAIQHHSASSIRSTKSHASGIMFMMILAIIAPFFGRPGAQLAR